MLGSKDDSAGARERDSFRGTVQLDRLTIVGELRIFRCQNKLSKRNVEFALSAQTDYY